MATPYFQVSRDAARALEDFSDEFKGALALGDVTPWAAQLGLVRQTSALKSTFPIPLDAAGYKELKGNLKFRSLYSRSLSMKGRTWQDGVEEYAAVLEAPDFADWAGQPAAMALEWMRLPNEIVADMLALSSLDGPLLDFYRDPDTDTASTRRLFAADHPCNVLKASVGTFDNTDTTTAAAILDGSFFDAANAHFRGILGPNGKPLGLRLAGGTCLVPSTRENVFKNALMQDTLINAITESGANVGGIPKQNLWKSTLSYVVADELADQDHFYVLAGGKSGLHPWVVQHEGSPEEIVHDKSSHKYKESLKVGLAYVGRAEAAAALPHRILRVEITA